MNVISNDFEKALNIGRPPNIKKLFPNSKALIVSGKYIDRAMLKKSRLKKKGSGTGGAIALAANVRNPFIIRGVLGAAQRADACVILEIARSEGGADAYCGVNFWNMARRVDAFCNELGITVPVAIHADHYGIKKKEDIAGAKIEIPSIFEAGVTSIAIDASHMPDHENLLANIELNPLVPKWAGLETEVGEIKGEHGLSTVEEALFLIRGLNSRSIFPDWIALNNGTTHGIETDGAGIQVGLTADIHAALSPYGVSGAQHGTSGNRSDRLKEIRDLTRTTKANVATALQMVSWGLEVNEYGNAILDKDGRFIKVSGQGVAEEMWKEMTAFAESSGISGGNYKKLNLPFENKLLGQPKEMRDRMAARVEEFAFHWITEVFGSDGTGSLAIEEIMAAQSHDPGPKVGAVEEPKDWTLEKIMEKASLITSDKGPEGDFDD